MLMLLSLMPSLPAEPATTYPISQIAQVTPRADGTDTIVDLIVPIVEPIVEPTYNITGGHPSGTNLFHSFEQFDVKEGEVANFIVTPNIENIVGRVIGSNSSEIYGTLQVLNSDANLFLVNPSGVILGPNALLNLGGSFTASTSDRFATGNDWLTTWNQNSFVNQNNPNSVVLTVGDPNGPPRDNGSIPFSLGSKIRLENNGFVSGDLITPGDNIFIFADSITTGDINTDSQPGGTVTLEAIAGGIITGNISTQGEGYYQDGSPRVEDGSVVLTSIGDIRTGEIEVSTSFSSAVDDSPPFGRVSLTSTNGNITVHYIESGPGGISISAPLGLFRAESAIIIDRRDFKPPNRDGSPEIFDLFLRDHPELVTFLESRGLAVHDPITNELYSGTIPVVFPDCVLNSCSIPISLWVSNAQQSQLPVESLIRIEHGGQSLTANGITAQGSNSESTPAFVVGPSLSVSNPSFYPNPSQQSSILSVSPSFSALNLSTELPPDTSGTVGGIFITSSNADVIRSILNRPFVPSVAVTSPPVVVTPPPVVVTPSPAVVTSPPAVVTLILLEESSSSVINRDEQGPTVSSHRVNAPLLRIAEDVLTKPCSASELTIAADGRYVLAGCESWSR